MYPCVCLLFATGAPGGFFFVSNITNTHAACLRIRQACIYLIHTNEQQGNDMKVFDLTITVRKDVGTSGDVSHTQAAQVVLTEGGEVISAVPKYAECLALALHDGSQEGEANIAGLTVSFIIKGVTHAND